MTWKLYVTVIFFCNADDSVSLVSDEDTDKVQEKLSEELNKVGVWPLIISFC